MSSFILDIRTGMDSKHGSMDSRQKTNWSCFLISLPKDGIIWRNFAKKKISHNIFVILRNMKFRRICRFLRGEIAKFAPKKTISLSSNYCGIFIKLINVLTNSVCYYMICCEMILTFFIPNLWLALE